MIKTYSQLSTDQKFKALSKANEKCFQSLLNLSWHSDEEGNPVELITDIGSMDKSQLLSLHKRNGFDAYMTVFAIFRDEKLSKGFDDWRREVAQAETYEIPDPVDNPDSPPPVAL